MPLKKSLKTDWWTNNARKMHFFIFCFLGVRMVKTTRSFRKFFCRSNTFAMRKKMIKIYFDWHLGSYFTHEPKMFNFQRYREIKMTQIIVFWSNRKIKLTKCSISGELRNLSATIISCLKSRL